MDPIRPSAPPPAPAGPAPAPPDRPAEGSAVRRPLDPAVSVDLSGRPPPADGRDDRRSSVEDERRGFERDAEAHTLVYRVTDLASGAVVVQIPDAVVLRARAYARDSVPPPGERVETQA